MPSGRIADDAHPEGVRDGRGALRRPARGADGQDDARPASWGRGRELLSVVIAAFNEEQLVAELCARLKEALASLPYDHELLFVDDGSTDRTLERLSAIAMVDPSVRVLELSRNFGKEAALSAGIKHALGDAVILIDADLEHPPEVIPSLVAEWENGADVVIGVRNERANESYVRRAASRLFAFIMDKISEVPAPARSTDFRLIDRAVADEFKTLLESKRLTRSLIDWLGFRRVYVAFDAGSREGKSRYGYKQLFGSALAAIVAHSRLPLYLAGYLGGGITLFSFLLGAFVLVEQFVLRDPMRLEVSGTAMLTIVTLFLSGIVLVCLGFIGVYIGTIRQEIAGRPLYVIRRPRRRATQARTAMPEQASVD